MSKSFIFMFSQVTPCMLTLWEQLMKVTHSRECIRALTLFCTTFSSKNRKRQIWESTPSLCGLCVSQRTVVIYSLWQRWSVCTGLISCLLMVLVQGKEMSRQVPVLVLTLTMLPLSSARSCPKYGQHCCRSGDSACPLWKREYLLSYYGLTVKIYCD